MNSNEKYLAKMMQNAEREQTGQEPADEMDCEPGMHDRVLAAVSAANASHFEYCKATPECAVVKLWIKR